MTLITLAKIGESVNVSTKTAVTITLPTIDVIAVSALKRSKPPAIARGRVPADRPRSSARARRS